MNVIFKRRRCSEFGSTRILRKRRSKFGIQCIPCVTCNGYSPVGGIPMTTRDIPNSEVHVFLGDVPNSEVHAF